MSEQPTPVTGTGKCPFCGHRLTLELAQTLYLGVTRISGGVLTAEGYIEARETNDGESSARLYCRKCGTEFVVPDNVDW